MHTQIPFRFSSKVQQFVHNNNSIIVSVSPHFVRRSHCLPRNMQNCVTHSNAMLSRGIGDEMPAPVVCPLEHDWEHRGVIIGSTTLPLSDDGNGSIHNFSRGRFNMPLIPEVPDHTLPCQRPPADKRLPLILLPRGCSTAALHNPTSLIVWPKDRTFIMSSSHSSR